MNDFHRCIRLKAHFNTKFKEQTEEKNFKNQPTKSGLQIKIHHTIESSV